MRVRGQHINRREVRDSEDIGVRAYVCVCVATLERDSVSVSAVSINSLWLSILNT